MAHDISLEDTSTWAARTATGMAFVGIARADVRTLSGAELVTVQNEAGAVTVARLIGPVTGDVPEDERWRLVQILAIDARGDTLASIVNGSAPTETYVEGHDWGALGLPDGFETRVRLAGSPPINTELAVARESSGHRLGQANLELSLAPGDRVRVGDVEGTVVAIDRRRRTVEIECGDGVEVVAFDEVQIQETT